MPWLALHDNRHAFPTGGLPVARPCRAPDRRRSPSEGFRDTLPEVEVPDGRPRVRARPDGDVAGVPHPVRVRRHRHAAPHGARRAAPPQDRRPARPRARQALGQGHRDPVRGRRGLGHRALVRARPALPRVHALCRAGHRHAVLARGLRVLPRGDRPGPLPLWVEAPVAARTPRLGRAGALDGRAVGPLRRHRERVDEHADRLHARCRRTGRRRRSLRGDAEPGRLHPDPAHDDRRLRGRRLRGRRHPRVAPAQAPGLGARPARPEDRALGRRGRRRAAAALGRSFGQAPGRAPADQARRDGGTLSHRALRAAPHRRHPRRGRSRHALRDRHPVWPLVPRLRRLRRRGGRGCSSSPRTSGHPCSSRTSRSR